MDFCKKPAYLLLEDGTLFTGKSLGFLGTAFGEVVFQTAMVGYQETLTDPANEGLIVAQTFPLIGNYGINDYSNESDKTHLSGYIVRETCDEPSNYRSTGTLAEFMRDNKVVGICDIDTRHLTKHIRENGVMNGMITTDEINVAAALPAIKAHKPAISTPTNITFGNIDHRKFTIGLINIGAKSSLITALIARGIKVVDRLDNVDGIVVSDGAGDPSSYTDQIKLISEKMNAKIPMLGIGIGHQLMALANGACVSKMKCGHRGANHPVKCLSDNKTYITSQNHGYVVTDIKAGDITYISGNDNSIEGIKYESSISVQFTPDVNATMVSTSFIYDDFIALMEGK